MESKTMEEQLSCNQNGEESILTKIRELFGDEIAQAFKDEDIIDQDTLGELLVMDSEAEIFKKLNLNFGKVIKLKNHFKSLLERKKLESKKRISHVQTKSKPTMASLESNPDIKAIYLKNRKRIGQLACKRWSGSYPKFNNPNARNDLEEFAKEIAPEVAVPQVGFDIEGIIEHVRDYFNEQRRHQKRSHQESTDSASSPDYMYKGKKGQKTSNKTNPPLPSMGKKTSKSGLHQVPPKTVQESASFKIGRFSESGSSEDEVPCSQSFYKKDEQFSSDEESDKSGDTVILNSEEDGKNDAVKIPDKLAPRVVKLILKLVCGSVVQDREPLVNLLVNKFSVPKRSLVDVNYTDLSEVVVKKFLKQGYVEVKNDVTVPFGNIMKSDLIVKKEIQL
ncbi:hypothetical protein AC249_AIPGENE1446 [Exaiptasia diaphana]|nr:hypothetical protein AC249_AIPGENE1446 [Exaiptasia diaphana]